MCYFLCIQRDKTHIQTLHFHHPKPHIDANNVSVHSSRMSLSIYNGAHQVGSSVHQPSRNFRENDQGNNERWVARLARNEDRLLPPVTELQGLSHAQVLALLLASGIQGSTKDFGMSH